VRQAANDDQHDANKFPTFQRQNCAVGQFDERMNEREQIGNEDA
jgi:hypothetical protein